MNLTRAITLGAAAAALAPAAAHAATLETDAPCYLTNLPTADGGFIGQAVGVKGTGWGPGTGWSVQADQIFASGTADPAGNWTDTTQVTAPLLSNPDSTTAKTVTLTAQQDGTDVASTTFQEVNFTVHPKDANGKPKGSTIWKFSGFTPGAVIYFHTLRSGKVYTQRVGTASTPCGTFSRRLHRLPAVPAKKIRYGTYKLAVDTNAQYKKADGSFNQYQAKIRIFKKYFR